jgi:hypothetical protein
MNRSLSRRILLQFVVLIGLFAATDAWAGRVCLTYPTSLADVGVGEDYWTANGPQPLQYAQVTISRADPPFTWTGYLDRSGCVSNKGLGAAGIHQVTVASKSGTITPTYGAGPVGVEVRDAGDCKLSYKECQPTLVEQAFPELAVSEAFRNGTHTFALPKLSEGPDASRRDAVFNGLLMSTYALSKDAGSIKNHTFIINVGTNLGTRLLSIERQNGEIEAATGSAKRKFILMHELGHAINWWGTTGGSNAASGGKYRWDEIDFAYNNPKLGDNCTLESVGGHHMKSVEYAMYAHIEGLAHAYAASIWNNRQEDDCWTGYYKKFEKLPTPTKMSCSSVPTPSGTYFREQRSHLDACLPAGERARLGTEYDWMRTWTRVLFDKKAPLSMVDINAFIKTGPGWSCGSPFDKPMPCNTYSFWGKLIDGKAGLVKTRLTAKDGGRFYGVAY